VDYLDEWIRPFERASGRLTGRLHVRRRGEMPAANEFFSINYDKNRSTSSALMTPTRTPFRSTTKRRGTFRSTISDTKGPGGASGVTEKTAGVIKSRTRTVSTFSTW